MPLALPTAQTFPLSEQATEIQVETLAPVENQFQAALLVRTLPPLVTTTAFVPLAEQAMRVQLEPVVLEFALQVVPALTVNQIAWPGTTAYAVLPSAELATPFQLPLNPPTGPFQV